MTFTLLPTDSGSEKRKAYLKWKLWYSKSAKSAQLETKMNEHQRAAHVITTMGEHGIDAWMGFKVKKDEKLKVDKLWAKLDELYGVQEEEDTLRALNSLFMRQQGPTEPFGDFYNGLRKAANKADLDA